MSLFRRRSQFDPCEPGPAAAKHADDAAHQVADATRELRLAYERIAPVLDQLAGVVAPARKDHPR